MNIIYMYLFLFIEIFIIINVFYEGQATKLMTYCMYLGSFHITFHTTPCK